VGSGVLRVAGCQPAASRLAVCSGWLQGVAAGIGLQHVNDDQSAQRDKPKRIYGQSP